MASEPSPPSERTPPEGRLRPRDARPDLTSPAARFGSLVYPILGLLTVEASPILRDRPLVASSLLALVALFGVGRWLHTRPNRATANHRWDLWFAFWTIGLAVVWSAIAVSTLLTYGSHPGSLVAVICTAGIAAAGTNSLAPRVKLLIVWLACLGLPVVAVTTLNSETFGAAVPISMTLFLVYLTRIGRETHTKYWDLLDSQHQLRDRAGELEREVEQRAEAERSLRDSEAHLRKVHEHSPFGIYDLDRKGRARSTNHAARKLSRALLDEGELAELGYAPKHLIHPEDLEWVKKLFQEAVLYGKEAEFECRNVRDGWLAGAIVPIGSDEWRVQHVVTILRDVTKRRQLDESLQEAVRSAEEASQLKSRFLANVSHEIRTPLNGVLGIARLLRDTELDLDQADLLGTLEASSESLLATMNDLLDFSKIESGTLQIDHHPLIPSDLVDRACAPFRAAMREAGLALEIADDSKGAEIVGDRDRLRQVLINLVSNAVKFTPEGSIRIHIGVERDESLNLEGLLDEEVESASWPGHLHLVVEDTGIGIPRERIERIFDAFEQVDGSHSRSQGGVGLGLAIARQLLEAMGGTIEVESEVDHGTRFSLTVPTVILEQQLRPGDDPPDDVAPSAGHPLQILLVEDNRVNRLVACRLVERIGHSVDVAVNGAEALEKIEARTFDLVLMDVQMPVMDGLEAVRQLREREAAEPGDVHLPVIAVTAHAMSDDRRQCLEAGMDDYLTKPIDAEQLERVIAHYQEDRPVS